MNANCESMRTICKKKIAAEIRKLKFRKEQLKLVVYQTRKKQVTNSQFFPMKI